MTKWNLLWNVSLMKKMNTEMEGVGETRRIERKCTNIESDVSTVRRDINVLDNSLDNYNKKLETHRRTNAKTSQENCLPYLKPRQLLVMIRHHKDSKNL